jgi:hypothetical protein
MGALALRCGLLADTGWTSGLEALRKGFARQAGDSNLFAVLLVLLGLCVFVVLLDRVYRLLQPRRQGRRVDYLVQAGRVAGLSGGQVRELRRLATRAGLAQPAAMLFSPANLAYGVDRALRGTTRPGARRRMNQLSLHLFGAPLPPKG